MFTSLNTTSVGYKAIELDGLNPLYLPLNSRACSPACPGTECEDKLQEGQRQLRGRRARNKLDQVEHLEEVSTRLRALEESLTGREVVRREAEQEESHHLLQKALTATIARDRSKGTLVREQRSKVTELDLERQVLRGRSDAERRGQGRHSWQKAPAAIVTKDIDIVLLSALLLYYPTSRSQAGWRPPSRAQ